MCRRSSLNKSDSFQSGIHRPLGWASSQTREYLHISDLHPSPKADADCTRCLPASSPKEALTADVITPFNFGMLQLTKESNFHKTVISDGTSLAGAPIYSAI